MDSIRDWTTVHEHLEHLLPHGLDAAMWEVLRQQSLPFVADELLWRVEAIARQVPAAQGPVFVHPIIRSGSLNPALCGLCAEQVGSGIGQRCMQCVAALCLVLGFPVLLDDAGKMASHEMISDQHTDRVESNLFEV